MNFIPGCPTCQAVIPDPVIVDHEDGSRTVHQTCPVCQYVWATADYTSGQALAVDQIAALDTLLADLRRVITANCGVEAFHAMEQEVALRYGPAAAEALRRFVEEVFAGEYLSRQAMAERRHGII